jgi:phage terminase Nu1 subunit (DNA packaging protein)
MKTNDLTEALVNVSQLTELYKVNRNTVDAWLKAGLPSTAPTEGNLAAGRLVHLATAVRWVRDMYSEKHDAVVEKLRAKIEGGAKERKLEAEARIKEVEAAERERKVLQSADVEAMMLSEADATREGMLGVARDAVQTGLIRPDQEAALQDLVRGALLSLASLKVEAVPAHERDLEEEADDAD